MAWEQLDVNKPHLVYIILGGFTSLFMLCSSVIKERLYIGEATVATICGIIFGPHAANLINPATWGNTDQITLEFARIVLVVQCFAVGVELPKYYMERHWRSVTFLLVPVMAFGWLVTSLFIWWMVPPLNWLDSLCVAACVTATDPVLASSVVGKGKFAKRVPRHLRDLLSAESGCNDGMAFPFIYLALYLIKYRPNAHEVAFHWFCYTILYECIFGAFYGVCVGYAARHAIRWAHEKDLIDRESFLVFYFVLALFCAGSGSILGMDDLLIGFSCGVGFSNDGWFLEKTEESHVSNVIDLLINLAFFVYFGTIIPWAQFNADVIGLSAWRLVVIGLFVIFFRRIPIMMALKPIIPDIKTWREALFAGHFGPIGVGAIFVAILARAELETDTTTPLAVLPEPGFEHLNIIELIWPITTFLVICSIIVHGSSIAVFTLGKHINTLTLTMSYTQANEEGPSWMDRLPRIQSRSKSSMSLRRPDDTESSMDEKLEYPANTLSPASPVGAPRNFLRRQKDDEPTSRSSSRQRPRSKKNWEHGLRPGGPISQSAIAPQARRGDGSNIPPAPSRSDSETIAMKGSDESPGSSVEQQQQPVSEEPEEEVYKEGDKLVFEDEEGNVLDVVQSHGETKDERTKHEVEEGLDLMKKKHIHHGVAHTEDNHPTHQPHRAESGKDKRMDTLKRMDTFKGWNRGQASEKPSEIAKSRPEPKRGPALAYQFGNTIIVEDEDGEVLKKYDIPADRRKSYADPSRTKQRLARMGQYLGMGHQAAETTAGPSSQQSGAQEKPKGAEEEDDERIRFTVGAGGRRMSKIEFIQQIQKLDPKSRKEFVEQSDVPEEVKDEARADAQEHADNKRRATDPDISISPGAEINLSNNTSSESTDAATAAAIEKAMSHEDAPSTGPDGLTRVQSNRSEIPFHSLPADLHQLSPGRSETAAQRRRRLASRSRRDEDSDDDGTERVPPQHAVSATRPRGSGPAMPPHGRLHTQEGETAAERRRREGALGISRQEESSDEDESAPRQVPSGAVTEEGPVTTSAAAARTPGIRFADQPSTGSRLRWHDSVGKRKG
ncbi:hypothetical protein EV356DRAFT_439805 [Viridothelium virens]|uniref:Na+/H+ antiporter n=1 Tax=Viridothelium virens TaxID=1048519 RepID=A0A6A6HLJ4_VIRVR|nr:hypothetical protein EV356DRAFT_439805 [Viridothelium virens]